MSAARLATVGATAVHAQQILEQEAQRKVEQACQWNLSPTEMKAQLVVTHSLERLKKMSAEADSEYLKLTAEYCKSTAQHYKKSLWTDRKNLVAGTSIPFAVTMVAVGMVSMPILCATAPYLAGGFLLALLVGACALRVLKNRRESQLQEAEQEIKSYKAQKVDLLYEALKIKIAREEDPLKLQNVKAQMELLGERTLPIGIAEVANVALRCLNNKERKASLDIFQAEVASHRRGVQDLLASKSVCTAALARAMELAVSKQAQDQLRQQVEVAKAAATNAATGAAVGTGVGLVAGTAMLAGTAVGVATVAPVLAACAVLGAGFGCVAGLGVTWWNQPDAPEQTKPVDVSAVTVSETQVATA